MVTSFFLLYLTAHFNEVDLRRERVSHYEKHFAELRPDDIQNPMKTKDKPTLEQLFNLNKFFLSCHLKTKPVHGIVLTKTILMNEYINLLMKFIIV